MSGAVCDERMFVLARPTPHRGEGKGAGARGGVRATQKVEGRYTRGIQTACGTEREKGAVFNLYHHVKTLCMHALM